MSPEEYAEALADLPVALRASIELAAIVALFYGLYVVAGRHFVPALSRVARALRMPPDVAGVTLLALGNGAPDFCTAVLGARSAPEMVVAGAVGSGLFSVTVVLGAVILSSPAAYPEGDKVEYVSSPLALPVDDLIADAVLPGRVPVDGPPQRPTLAELLRARLPKVSRSSFVRSAVAYSAGICALAAIAFAPRVPILLAVGMIAAYAVHVALAIATFLRARNTSPIAEAAASFADECAAERRERAFLALAAEGPVGALWFVIRHGILLPAYRRGWPSCAIALATAPVDAVMAATIPPVAFENECLPPKEHVARRAIERVRLVALPLILSTAAIVAIDALQSPFRICAVALAAGGVSVAAWAASSWERPLDGSSAHASLCLTLVACGAWVYLLSNEAVSCLQALGTALDVPETLLGLIILAWGNTFGDLVADSAVARAGGVETAVIAAFAGPAQNVLLSLGVTFAISGVESAQTSDLAVRAALILVTFVTVSAAIAAPCLWRMRVPRAAGAILLGIYAAFVPLALFLGLSNT